MSSIIDWQVNILTLLGAIGAMFGFLWGLHRTNVRARVDEEIRSADRAKQLEQRLTDFDRRLLKQLGNGEKSLSERLQKLEVVSDEMRMDINEIKTWWMGQPRPRRPRDRD